MGKNVYLVKLNDEQRRLLTYVVNDQTQSKRTRLRAQILLKSDLNENDKLTVLDIAKQLNTTHTTIQTVRTEFHKLGLEKAVFRKERSDNIATRRINTQVRNEIVSLAKQQPPDGHKRWTLRLLASEAVARGIVDRISIPTIDLILDDAHVDLKQ